MADRATVLSGAFQKVTLGATSKVLGAGTFEISGAVRKTFDVSEFGVDVDIFEFASANGGTISIPNVHFDPTDPMQNYLRTCVLTAGGIKLDNGATSGIRFWINSSSYYAPGTSGHILLTNAGKISADRNGGAKTDFSGQVSGAFMCMN